MQRSRALKFFAVFVCLQLVPIFGTARADHNLVHGLLQTEAPRVGRVFDETISGSDQCQSTRIFPILATDGTEMTLDVPDARANTPVRIRGYRYDDSAPTNRLPEGEGRSQMYCGCQRVREVVTEDIDGGSFGSRFSLRIPDDAPSGDYSFEVLPEGSACPSGGIETQCDEPEICLRPSVTVAPSHLVVSADQIIFNANAEDADDHPAEIQFSFGALSGEKSGENNAIAKFSGAFPAGGSGSSHVTNSDNSVLFANFPLFTSKEARLSASECREECIALPAALGAACTTQCTSQESLGEFNDQIEFAISGVERDSSPSKAWGVAAGVGSAALICYLLPDCLGSILQGGGAATLGTAIGGGLNEFLSNDDDELGTAESTFRKDVNDWGTGPGVQSIPFAGGEKGDLSIKVANKRLPAPSILKYVTKLNSLKLIQGYEGPGCDLPNEIFLNVQADLHRGAEILPAPQRIPAGSALIKMNAGDSVTLDQIIDGPHIFTSGNAPEAPFVYVSIAVWENDRSEQKDLIGVASNVHATADIANFFGAPELQVSSEGFFKRSARLVRTVRLEGYEGSDDHCTMWATAGDGDDRQGMALVEYQIDIEWMVTPDLR